MGKVTLLDKQWHELMFLCQKESTYRQQGNHPRLIKLVAAQLEELAAEMGFSQQQIQTREFRAERDGVHILRIDTDS